MKRFVCSVLFLTTPLAAAAQPAHHKVGSPAPSATLNAWFAHIQRNETDSLRPLLAPDFLFVSDGARIGPDAFVAMIKSLGISHPRVQLSNVATHQTDRIAYLVYDRTESFESRGVTKTVPETGTMVLIRRGSRWLIAQWTTTSPPLR